MQQAQTIMGRHSTERLSWSTICAREGGRWVALDNCAFDSDTGQARAGAVVDSDSSLVDLCERLRAAKRSNCQIVFCENAS
jgi:hypothetical protein